jgi:hypothetical protein
MRALVPLFSACALFTGGCGAFFDPILAVPQDAKQPLQPLDPRTEAVVKEWSERTSSVRSIWVEFSIDEQDQKEIIPSRKGNFRWIGPNMARLDFNAVLWEVEEHWIVPNNREVWYYQTAERSLYVYDFKPPITEPIAELIGLVPLELFLPVPVDLLRRRHEIRVVRDEGDAIVLGLRWRCGTSPHFFHTSMLPFPLPVVEPDPARMIDGEVVLSKKTYRPKTVSVHISPTRTQTWTFTDVVANADDIKPRDFQPWHPPVKKKWRVIRKSLLPEAFVAKPGDSLKK